MAGKNKQRINLTLKDRLSRLTPVQAGKLLGEQGQRLIHQGGSYEIDIDRDVQLKDDEFRMRLNGAVVRIEPRPDAPGHLRWNCTQCGRACAHVGAAFSLILEEKTTLGLAKAPAESAPLESLSEEELIHRAVEERAERARTERMTVRSAEPQVLWTDYLVTSATSGRTYRVALRGWEPEKSYCSCPDYRKNTLGVCKHILHVQRKVRSRFPAATRNRPFRQKEFAVHLRYGRQIELWLLAAEKPSDEASRIVKPIRDRAIDDVHDLLKRVQRLESCGYPVTIYPDAEAYIERRLFMDRIASIVRKIRKNPKNHPLRRNLLKTELLPYQLDGIAFAVGAGRAILADDMGLGKTIQGIGVAELLAREAGISRVLVICPASLKSQWRSEIDRFSDRDAQLVIGSAAERVGQYDNGCFFTICNYEQVLRDILAIERVPWDLIVLDEGQRIKNWEAQTSQVVKALRSTFALVLTGTPLENRLDDLYSVTEFIDDRRLGPAFRFFHRHRVVDDKGKVLGYKNLEELRRRLKPILLRRTRASVMRDLPPRSTEIIRVAPTEEQSVMHGSHLCIVSSIVRKPYLTEMDVLRLRKALLMCRMAADSTFLVDKQEPVYSSKLERLEELLEDLFAEEGRKAVLFSEWTTMLGLIEPVLKKHDLAYVRLDGSIPQNKRRQLVDTFQKDPDCRLFITTNAGSTGLNLQAADTVINVDLPWNPAVLEQRIARAHRMGQKRPVQVYVLVTEGTIEESLLGTLSAKHELALAALDVDSDVDAVEVVSNAEDLKRRMEVLLGAAPAAPVDVSAGHRAAEEADRLARREKVSEAGGQLLGAAFSLLSELVPEQASDEPTRQATQALRQRLADCMDTDDAGRLHLTVTLPDEAALDRLAGSLAQLMHLGKQAG